MKINTFNKVRKYLNSIEAINRGGCGIATLTMWEWLKNHNQLLADTMIVYLYEYSDKDRAVTNIKKLQGKRVVGGPRATSHICIYHKGKYIDCQKEINIAKYEMIQHIDSYQDAEQFLRDTINNIGDWNPWFNRQNIEIIEKTLNIKLNVKIS